MTNSSDDNGGPAQHSVVEALVSDPANVPRTTILRGYFGRSSVEGHHRLYLDRTLGSWVEIPASEILHVRDLPDERGSEVWIRPDVPLTYQAPQGPAAEAEFLSGPVSRRGLPAGQAEPEGGQIPAEQLAFPTEIPVRCPTEVPVRCPTEFGPRCPTSVTRTDCVPCPTETTPTDCVPCPTRTTPTDCLPCPTRTPTDCLPCPTRTRTDCFPCITDFGPRCPTTVTRTDCVPCPTQTTPTDCVPCPTQTTPTDCVPCQTRMPTDCLPCPTRTTPTDCLPCPTEIGVRCPTGPMGCPTNVLRCQTRPAECF